MLDKPVSAIILNEVSAALKAGIPPGVQQHIAANAISLASRENELSEGYSLREAQRLKALLKSDGELAALNSSLCLSLRKGELDCAEKEVRTHLILTTLEKIMIDQPGYPAFRLWQTSRGMNAHEN